MLRHRLMQAVGGQGGGALFLDGRTDVATAYSGRRVSTAYAGSLLRVRRSSDSAEQDFGAGLLAIDWSAILAFIGGGSGFIAKWYDQSGSGRDAIQATAAAQPQVSLLSNSLPGMVFDGSNDGLVAAAFGALAQPTSFNVVYRRITLAHSTVNVFDGASADQQTLYASAAADNRLYAGVTVNGDLSVSQPLGTRGAVGGTFNGASSLIEVNGATIASFSGDAGSGSINGITLGGQGGGGATRFDNIEMQEFILFNAGHTSSQLKADNAAMRAAWGF